LARYFAPPPKSTPDYDLERALLFDCAKPRTDMKNPPAHQTRRRSRRNPWNSKNIKLLRAALRVWELKQRAAHRI